MNFDSFYSHLQYVERSGNTFNIDEKMRLGLAVKQLKLDLCLNEVYIVGKITGKLIFIKIKFLICNVCFNRHCQGILHRHWCQGWREDCEWIISLLVLKLKLGVLWAPKSHHRTIKTWKAEVNQQLLHWRIWHSSIWGFWWARTDWCWSRSLHPSKTNYRTWTFELRSCSNQKASLSPKE